MAASQCPSCGHLFEVRDGFGDLLPLSFCSACESYYPAHVGSCKWCGTTPEPPPDTSRLWKIAGAVGAAGLIGITWLLRSVGDAPPPTVAQQAEQVAPAPVATAPAPVVAGAPIIEAVSAPAATPIELAPSVASAPPASAVPKARAPASRWTNSIAKDWAVVRAGPSKETRIVASIGPGARVQLGESQGTWRRIRARGIAGWVEPRASFAAVARSWPRARTVVSR